MFKPLINLTICLVMVLGSLSIVGGEQTVSAEEITIFESPGIAAYSKFTVEDGTLDFYEIAKGSCIAESLIEVVDDNYYICSIHIDNYENQYDPFLFVKNDYNTETEIDPDTGESVEINYVTSWIMAYYRDGEPIAKMVDVINFDLENTLLEQAISKVVNDVNLFIDPDGLEEDIKFAISYDHFGYPDADKVLLLAEEKDVADIDNFFVLTMPIENTYFERSYAFFQNYYPDFILNNVDFVLSNAIYAGSPTLGTIYGSLSSLELQPAIDNLLIVDSYALAPDGTVPAGFGVLSLVYQHNGFEISTTSNDDILEINLINDSILVNIIESIFPKPGDFSKKIPTDATKDQVIKAYLSWEESEGATSYEYCVDTTDDLICDTNWVNVGVELTSTVDLEFDTTYFWQVRAVNANGFTFADGGDWWSFITETMPAPGDFDKVSPVEGELISPTNVLLDWTDSYAATSYEYCIDEINNNLCDILDEENNEVWTNVGAATSKTLNVEFGRTYYWQVRAINENEESPTYADDEVWGSFSTTNIFNKISPEDGATGLDLNVTLRWEKLGTATYEYCISTSTTCNSWVSTGTSNSVSISKLKMSTEYYWQVKATNSYGVTVFANSGVNDLWKFTTKGPKKGK